MANDVLLRFLDSGLIDVGGDDTKFDKLQQTSKDLAAALAKSPTLATAFALIAFDPKAPVDDPVVVQALASLKLRWPTYMNTFSGPPIAVVRAMLLDALVQAASDDERIGVAFVTSARNALPFVEAGDELAIWTNVVADLESRVDVRAEAEWATPESIVPPALNVEAPKLAAIQLKSPTVKRDSLATKIREAAGPNYYSPDGSTPATNGNPHWPHSAGAHWNTDFSTRMAEAIGGIIEAVAEKTTLEQPDLSAPFGALATEVAAYVEATLKAVNGATAGLQRRTNLLWWKEALYSPTARVRYRELPQITAASLMGFDLHSQVPTFSPASVAAFLVEAVECLPELEAERKHSIRALVADAQLALAAASLRAAAANLVAKPEGRGPVLALIAYPEMAGNLTDEQFERLIGVPADAELTLPDWSAWLFRELQAARAVTDGGTAKRRGKKG